MVQRSAVPCCGGAGRVRARDHRAGRGRARGHCAATAIQITPHTAFFHAPLPTEHLKPSSSIEHTDGQGICNTLVWPCSGRPCSGPPCSGPPSWVWSCSAPPCCIRKRHHSRRSIRSRALPTEHLKPWSRIEREDGQGVWNTLVWPCSASPCLGPPCSGPPCSAPPCCNRKRDSSRHSIRSRASSSRASQTMEPH
jgi:hypothetical protein